MITNLQNINSTNGQVGINVNAGTSADTELSALAQGSYSDSSYVPNSSNIELPNKANDIPSHNLSDTAVKKVTDKLNEMADNMNIQLKFVWYKQLDQLGVRMVDINTNKTIKSFPPEDMMKALIRTKEWVGKFLDKEI